MIQKKIKVAFIYKTSDKFFSGTHFDNTTYDFFMKALKRNSEIEVTYFHGENEFDTRILKGKFDIVLLAGNTDTGAPSKLIGINELSIPVISRTGDFHNAPKYNSYQFHEKYKIDYYFNFMDESYFYKFYPRNYNYKVIIFGLETSLFQNVRPFKERIKNKIINSGALGNPKISSRLANKILNPKRTGWYFYKLRTMCNKLDYVEHTREIKKEENENYISQLAKYRAAIAATTFYPTIKYWETAGAGCLTFMEITDINHGKYLGYEDNKTAIFINEKNYKTKFEKFLNDPDNPEWENIANAGRKFTIENINNDKAVKSLVNLMKELIR